MQPTYGIGQLYHILPLFQIYKFSDDDDSYSRRRFSPRKGTNKRLPTFYYLCGKIGHPYPQSEATIAAFPNVSRINMDDVPYKPTLGSTEKGYPPFIYKEYLSAASIVTTINLLL